MRKKCIFVFLLFVLNLIFISPVFAECDDYKTESECSSNGCIWSNSFCIYSNATTNDVVSCGNGQVSNIPSILPKTVTFVYRIIEIAVPVLLVIFGMLDLFKGLSAQKEEEIKKGQQMFVKRLISGVIIFFVFAIVKLLISVSATNIKTGSNIINCVECFISNNCTK